jgi:hypothetical protein
VVARRGGALAAWPTTGRSACGIANPADPAAEPQTVRYPAAGTNNAIVTLHAARRPCRRPAWDRGGSPVLRAAGTRTAPCRGDAA